MQLLLTSAAHSNIGQGGDTIIQTQNCVSPCAWVKLIFSVSQIVILAQGPCSLHAQFSRRLDLCVSSLSRGSISSSQGEEKKTTTRICACNPCASHTSVSFKKTPTQILTVILVQGPCSNIQSHTIFVQKPCNSVQKKKLRHPCAGAMQQCPAEDKASGSSRSSYLQTSIRGFHRFAPREHHGRSFRRETWR